VKCCFSSAQMVALAGREGGQAPGGAVDEVDWVVVLHGQRASTAVVRR